MSEVSSIGSDRVRCLDQEFERPAMTKMSSSKGTMKDGLIEDHNKKMTVQKLVFHKVQYILKYIFLSTANWVLWKFPEVTEENVVSHTESYGGHKS